MLKKGAMFGLDARIALAIFGALSVISGAALYSAIQQSKTTAILTQASEIEKALSSYYLDTGVLPGTTGVYALLIKNLTTNPNVAGWNGPYLGLKEVSGADRLSHQETEHSLNFLDSDSWGTIADRTCNKTDDNCSVYICIVDTTIADLLEEFLDNNSAPTASDYLSGNARSGSGCTFVKTSIPFNPANSPNA